MNQAQQPKSAYPIGGNLLSANQESQYTQAKNSAIKEISRLDERIEELLVKTAAFARPSGPLNPSEASERPPQPLTSDNVCFINEMRNRVAYAASRIEELLPRIES